MFHRALNTFRNELRLLLSLNSIWYVTAAYLFWSCLVYILNRHIAWIYFVSFAIKFIVFRSGLNFSVYFCLDKIVHLKFKRLKNILCAFQVLKFYFTNRISGCKCINTSGSRARRIINTAKTKARHCTRSLSQFRPPSILTVSCYQLYCTRHIWEFPNHALAANQYLRVEIFFFQGKFILCQWVKLLQLLWANY